MKQKLIYLLTLICTFVFGLTPVCAQEDVVIEATATYQKNHTVVMDVQLNDEHITSGRVVVGYQGKELSLQKVESKLEWDVKDLLEEGETKKTVAYAYASADEIGKKGTLLHLVFDVNEKMKGKTIPIQVEITELYLSLIHILGKKLGKRCNIEFLLFMICLCHDFNTCLLYTSRCV